MPPTKEPQPVDLDSPAYEDAKAASKPPSHNTKTRRQIEIQTESPDIKMADVSRNSMWIFDYGSDPRHSLFVMKCPRNCQSPVFTKHPLMEERAASHLRRCRVPFRSEKDMIRRYARRGKQAMFYNLGDLRDELLMTAASCVGSERSRCHTELGTETQFSSDPGERRLFACRKLIGGVVKKNQIG